MRAKPISTVLAYSRMPTHDRLAALEPFTRCSRMALPHWIASASAKVQGRQGLRTLFISCTLVSAVERFRASIRPRLGSRRRLESSSDYPWIDLIRILFGHEQR